MFRCLRLWYNQTIEYIHIKEGIKIMAIQAIITKTKSGYKVTVFNTTGTFVSVNEFATHAEAMKHANKCLDMAEIKL